jgi:hypothetical protein
VYRECASSKSGGVLIVRVEVCTECASSEDGGMYRECASSEGGDAY